MDLQRPKKRFIPVTSFLLNIHGTQIRNLLNCIADYSILKAEEI